MFTELHLTNHPSPTHHPTTHSPPTCTSSQRTKLGAPPLGASASYSVTSALQELSEFLITPSARDTKDRQKLLRNLRVGHQGFCRCYMQYDNCFQLMLHIMMCWLQNILYICDCECVCVYVRVCVCACICVCCMCLVCVLCVCCVCVCVVCACIKVLELVMEVLKLFRPDAEDAR